MSFLKRVLIRSILKLHFYEYFFPGPKDRAKYFVEKVAEDNMKNTTDILIDIKETMKDTNDIFILIDNLVSSLKDGREELCILDPKDAAEKAAEDNMKDTKVKILLIFHYAANNAAEKAGGNSAEKAAIYRKIFADLYHTQYFAIIEAYKKAAEKPKNL